MENNFKCFSFLSKKCNFTSSKEKKKNKNPKQCWKRSLKSVVTLGLRSETLSFCTPRLSHFALRNSRILRSEPMWFFILWALWSSRKLKSTPPYFCAQKFIWSQRPAKSFALRYTLLFMSVLPCYCAPELILKAGTCSKGRNNFFRRQRQNWHLFFCLFSNSEIFNV